MVGRLILCTTFAWMEMKADPNRTHHDQLFVPYFEDDLMWPKLFKVSWIYNDWKCCELRKSASCLAFKSPIIQKVKIESTMHDSMANKKELQEQLLRPQALRACYYQIRKKVILTLFTSQGMAFSLHSCAGAIPVITSNMSAEVGSVQPM